LHALSADLWILLPPALAIAGGASAWLAIRLWTRHRATELIAIGLAERGRPRALVFVLGSIAVWLLAYGIELAVPHPGVSMWMHRIVYVAIATLAPSTLWIALEVRGIRSWLEGRRRWALVAVPSLSISLALTSDLQASFLIFDGFISVGPLTPLATRWGPYFWVHMGFSYACLLGALLLFAREAMVSERRVRAEIGAVATALCAPLVCNALTVFPTAAVEGLAQRLDLTPFGLMVSVPALAWIVGRDPMAQVLASAREAVIEALGDAVLLVDERRRAFYANSRAQELLRTLQPKRSWSPGMPLSTWWEGLDRLLARLDANATEELAITTDPPRTFDVRVTESNARGIRMRVVALRDITDRRRAEQAVRQLAFYDGLTGLANRYLFKRQLARAVAAARAGGHALALLYLDLDNFKNVNDSMGHMTGDALLRSFAERLREGLRGGDLIGRVGSRGLARLGGDEFAILLGRIATAKDAGLVARRVLANLSTPIEADGERVVARASIGIAVFPQDASDAETLMRNADAALYEAKDAGRNQYQFFRPSLNRDAKLRIQLEQHLERALPDSQLRVVYQPRLDLQTMKPTGFEALLRWRSPELGDVPPVDFIPVAERTGQIVQIGTWVLEQAIAHTRAWRRAGLPALGMAVNISSRQLEKPEFAGKVIELLRHYETSPQELELEITEGTLLANDDVTISSLADLRRVGVQIALDDFGTGYSSLRYLHELSPDALKLDRSFVQGIEADRVSAGIVAAVLAMARSLGVRVVAEGVERKEELRVLHSMGCNEVQGYLYSQPMEAEEVPRFLREVGPTPT
jgi:diguanylate cyclase (GGDEF)-like protein